MNTDWLDCVRWCHSNENVDVVDAHVDSLLALCRHSNYATPILTQVRDLQGRRAAGYLILYPGALASIGNLRCEPSNNEEQDRAQLASLAKDLFFIAFEQGAEMIQAISLLIPDGVSSDAAAGFLSPDPMRDLLLKESEMIPVAKLVQMECIDLQSIPKLVVSQLTRELGEVHFVPHYELPLERWAQLVESTYANTLDVPELNGLRNIQSTLAGYASTVLGTPQSWWIVRCNDADIGCLLLTPTSLGCCELTYVGLKSEWRGKGLSKLMMNFVRDWALQNASNGITLAVDLRNTPAIRLYQACGFTPQRFVQAWVRFPKSVARLSEPQV